MKFLPFEHAMRNLARTPGRSVASAIGAALVAALATLSLGFMRGMESSLENSANPHNVLLLGSGSEESIERSEIPDAAAGIAASSLSGLRETAGTIHVSPEVHVQLPVRAAQRNASTSIEAGSEQKRGRLTLCRGITAAAFVVHEGVRISEGRRPRAGKNELAIGRALIPKLFGSTDQSPIGRQISVDDGTWTIRGVLDAGGRVAEGEIWMPLNDLRVLTQRESLSCVSLTIDPTRTNFQTIDAFTKRRIDLELVAMTESDYYSGLFEFFRPIRLLIGITCLLIGLGALLGGIPIQAATFASRTPEVGTLQVVGFSRLSVVISFIQESMTVALAGAAVGIAVCLLLLDGWSIPLSIGSFGIAIDEQVVLWGIAFGTLVGIIGAAVPTFLALNLPIARAVRGH